MLFEDSYQEVVASSEGLFKDKGSKFIAYAFHVKDEDEVKSRIAEIKKKEYAARHHCYAYILNPDKSAQRDSDDGEPSNTAGKPILGQILSNNLTNTLIIVVRYFGGVKLGVGGLINAYRNAAAAALENIVIEQRFVKEVFSVYFQYPEMNNVMRIVKDLNLNVIEQNFELECQLTFSIRKSQSEKMQSKFALNHKVKLAYQKTI
ncbi:MAG: YigZ family protein [Flavobacteriales bacterium]|nr:YigZ family protein [Flavobacteriales bacterium]